MRRALALVIPALLLGLAAPAWADKDKDKGGKGKHGHGNRGGPVVVVQPVRVRRARPRPRHRLPVLPHRILRRPLPAGLGQEGQWLPAAGPGEEGQLWVIGQPLPPAVVPRPVPPVVVQQLAPVPPGYEYVRVDDDVLLMDKANRMVADVVYDLGDYDSLGLD